MFTNIYKPNVAAARFVESSDMHVRSTVGGKGRDGEKYAGDAPVQRGGTSMRESHGISMTSVNSISNGWLIQS